MISNMPYWRDRDQMAKHATIHMKEMEKYPIGKNRIYSSKTASELGADGIVPEKRTEKAGLRTYGVTDNDTVAELFDKYPRVEGGNICVLNFASYKTPGGGFIKGSIAQEESLCHSSNLYNTLLAERDYYAWNREHLNKGLYYDRAIFSQDVTFVQDDNEIKADVLTCAAPNWAAGLKYGFIKPEENSKTLHERISFVLDVMEQEGVRVAILGAFGCGVFRQDAGEVAKIFKEETEKSSLIDIVYAVPTGIHRENHEAFKSTILPHLA